MNLNSSFVRKIIYLCGIAALLFPLFMLGQPKTVRQPGGELSQLREKYDLSQAELGEIDPAGESMKLATLGMRGVAATVLWHKANEYKKKEDWDKLSATLNQITKLQPNYTAVWENQAHNLSYNVSVNFDNFQHRYHWVRKGIEFLVRGTRVNRREPRLLWYTGWFFGQKFGRADEHKQFRRIFRTDNDFHDEMQVYVDIDREARGPDNKPDNWLTGRLWYRRGQDLADNEGIPIRGKSPLHFHCQVPMSRINYCVAIEEEGFLDEQAEVGWRRALDEFLQFGNRLIPTSWGELIRLNDHERVLGEIEKTSADLDSIVTGARKQLYDERFSSLTEEQREALAIPMEKRTGPQYMAAYEAQSRLQIGASEIADRSSPENRVRARRVARKIEEFATTADRIRRYRDQVNYDYWKMRCEAEQLHEAVSARKHMFDGNRLKDAAALDQALVEYDTAWELWAQIFKKFPQLQEDRSDDLSEALKKYREVILALDKKIPDDFVLRGVLERSTGTPLPVGTSQGQPSNNESTTPTPDSPTPAPPNPDKNESADKPKTNEQPKAEEKPKADEQPKPEDKPKTEEKPKSEDTPKSDDPPKTGDKPNSDDKPKPDDKPKSEDNPKSEDKPKSDDQPKPDEKSKPDEKAG